MRNIGSLRRSEGANGVKEFGELARGHPARGEDASETNRSGARGIPAFEAKLDRFPAPARLYVSHDSPPSSGPALAGNSRRRGGSSRREPPAAAEMYHQLGGAKPKVH